MIPWSRQTRHDGIGERAANSFFKLGWIEYAGHPEVDGLACIHELIDPDNPAQSIHDRAGAGYNRPGWVIGVESEDGYS